MGEDTTGRTLTEELCVMLFFGLNRGKRHFLMTGGLPSGTCICNIEAHDWWHRETWCTWQQEEMILYLCKGANKAKALNIWKAEEEIQYDTDIKEHMHEIVHPDVVYILRSTWHASYHLRFFLFLLYCSEETLLLFFFGWLRGVQHYSIWASPENKTKGTEHDVPTKNNFSAPNKTWQFLLKPPCHVTSVKFNLPENCLTEQCTMNKFVLLSSWSKLEMIFFGTQHKLCSVVVRGDNYQGSNAGWRLEWFVKPVPSPEWPEPRLWPLLSWKELSGRGEGTVQQTQQISSFTFWCKIIK